MLLVRILLVAGAGLLLLIDKGDVVLWLNRHHHIVADHFFKYATHLGDGMVPVILILVAVLVRYRLALLVSAIALMQLIVSQLSKRVLFSDMPRPRQYFGDHALRFVDGVDVHLRYAFPSGHTLTAFSVATLMVFLFPEKKWVGIVAFVYAITVGISRIYLAQHFFMDVYAGAMLGVFFTGLIFFWMRSRAWYANPRLANGLVVHR